MQLSALIQYSLVIFAFAWSWTIPIVSSHKNGKLQSKHPLLRGNTRLDKLEFIQYLDASCGFNAPQLENAFLPKIRKRFFKPRKSKSVEYLEAQYKCVNGYKLLNDHQVRLYCSRRKWIGAIPICVKEDSAADIGHGIQMDERVTPTTKHEKCEKCQQFEDCVILPDNRTECICKSGFHKVDGNCTDINECKLSNDCQHKCKNLLGSYKCICQSGYRLSHDGKSCEDINECLLRNGHGPCEDKCTNTVGSYMCGCSSHGTKLSVDGHSCDDVNECDIGTSGCSHQCINTRGRVYCDCPPGMVLDDNWKTCSEKPLGDQPEDEYYDEEDGEDEYVDGDDEEDSDYEEELRRRDYDEDEEEINQEEKEIQVVENHKELNKLENEKNNKNITDDDNFNYNQLLNRAIEEQHKKENKEEIEPENLTTEIFEAELETTKADNEINTNLDMEKELKETSTSYNNNTDLLKEIEEQITNETSLESPKLDNDQHLKEVDIDLKENENEENINNAPASKEIQEVVLNKTHTWQTGNTQTEINNSTTTDKILKEDSLESETEMEGNEEITMKALTTVGPEFVTSIEDKNQFVETDDDDLYDKDEYDYETEENEDLSNRGSTTIIGIAATTTPSPPPPTTTTTTTTTMDPTTEINIDIFDELTTEEHPVLSTPGDEIKTTAIINTREDKFDDDNDDEDDEDSEDENAYDYNYEDYNEPVNNFGLNMPSIPFKPLPTTSSTTEPSTPSTTAIVMTKLCISGYALNENFDCVDINECEEQDHGCSDICENTVGSYKCTCPAGYEIKENDKYMCQDVDECALNMCSHNCTNTPGSYECECPGGWILTKNNTCDEILCEYGYNITKEDNTESYTCLCPAGLTINEFEKCVDIDECALNVCEHDCVNTHGSYNCSCWLGYQAIGDDCEDINECFLDNGNCTQLCANLPGSYECGCKSNYYLMSDNRTCNQIDPCLDDNGLCSDICSNVNGIPECACNPGRELFNETHCIKSNPCKVNNGGCSHLCSYEYEEGVTCDCPEGHLLQEDDKTCARINPCFENNGGCSHFCIMQEEKAVCSCPDHSYELINNTCFKRNLCLQDNGGCSHICEFHNEQVHCSCPENHKLIGKSCEKRNPCEEGNGGCSHFCNYIDDEIICECPEHYELRGKVCERIDPCLINNGGCSHECISDEYEVECHCPINYELSHDNKTCKAQDPCYNNGGCSHYCIAHRGRTLCYCPFNYQLQNEKNCVKIDPCLENNGGCSHICHNKQGLPECSCPEYLVLQNRTECHNPCNENNGGCSHECKVTQGVVQCLCPSGYAFDINDSQNCIELDPCEENNGGCSHTCLNVEGEAVCTCPDNDIERYELIDHHTCKPINPCLINNGGCSDKCDLVDDRVKCSCPEGFTLHGKVCLDDNPCRINNGGCSHLCSVRNQLKECSCPAGFVLKPNKHTCQDVNECIVSNGGCSHECRNLPGSYKCACPSNLVLDRNNRTCGPIKTGCDINNGGCEHMCEERNDGSTNVRCTCHDGFELGGDGKSCMELNFFECEVKTPKFGKVKCSRHDNDIDYVAVGTQCLYSCEPGYKLAGDDLRTCEYTGEWDSDEPYCLPMKHCSKLAQPLRGRVIPHACTTDNVAIGQKCGVICKKGFKLADKAMKNLTCNEDLRWNIDEEHLRNACVPNEIPKPFIRCPSGGSMSFVLPQSAKSMRIHIPRPDSNVDWWKYVSSEPSWGMQLSTVLPPGRFEVNYTATSPLSSNLSSTCKLIIHVKDEEPPKVYQCPSNQEVRLQRNEYSKNVYWPEPRFEDNIGIRTLYKSKESGAKFDYGLHHVNYIASDDAGNRAYCHFSINVVNYYQTENNARHMTKYRAVLICPHGIQYMSSGPDNYNNSIPNENGCKWTYIRQRSNLGHLQMHQKPHQQQSRHANQLLNNIPYSRMMRPTRQHFNWCC